MSLNRALLAFALPMTVGLWAAAPVLAAKGELIDIAWSPDGSFGRDVRVAPSKFVEVCGRLPAGTAVAWRFESGARLDFNVHFHEGKDVRYPTRQAKVARATGTLDAPVDQDYCWMWTNPTAAEATLNFMLQKR
jgi:hypothetical protein